MSHAFWRRWGRLRGMITAVGLGVGLLAAVLSVSPAAAAAQPTTWQVQVGGQTPDMAIETMGYYPGTITIDAGDTVTWTVASAEPHTVTFLSGAKPPSPLDPAAQAPAGGSTYAGTGLFSSGMLFMGKTYSLTFTQPGTYTYICTIHPGMQGTVVVQPAGTPYPHTQADYTAQAQQAVQADIAAGQAAASSYKVTTTAGPGGTTVYHMANGAGSVRAAIMRFLPGTLTVHAGDQVVWTNVSANMVHTITILAAGQKMPAFPSPEALTPAGGTVYDGSGFFNSGIEGPGQSYALTFTKPGTYTYYCLLHDDMGMVGKVVVLPKGATLPQTGASPWYLITGLLCVGLGAVTVLFTRLRRSAA